MAEFGSVDPVDLVDLVVAKCLVVALASLDSKSLVAAVVAWALPMWMEGLVGLVSWNTLELGGWKGAGSCRDFLCVYDDVEVTKGQTN